MSQYDLVVLWTDGDWRCEFHRGVDGDGFLAIFHGERIVAAERTPSETVATLRAELLHQRVLRGDLKDLNPPACPKCGGVVRITGQRYPMVYFKCDACHVSGVEPLRANRRDEPFELEDQSHVI